MKIYAKMVHPTADYGTMYVWGEAYAIINTYAYDEEDDKFYELYWLVPYGCEDLGQIDWSTPDAYEEMNCSCDILEEFDFVEDVVLFTDNDFGGHSIYYADRMCEALNKYDEAKENDNE